MKIYLDEHRASVVDDPDNHLHVQSLTQAIQNVVLGGVAGPKLFLNARRGQSHVDAGGFFGKGLPIFFCKEVELAESMESVAISLRLAYEQKPNVRHIVLFLYGNETLETHLCGGRPPTGLLSNDDVQAVPLLKQFRPV